MAPTLTSNSFLIGTTPHARTFSVRTPRLRVLAKKAGPFSPFQIGKQKDDDSENGADVPGNSSPFKFDFSKAPDMKSLIPVVSNPASGLSFGNVRRKDPGTVFVAGATGLAGIRIAQTLLRQGFTVRAGVPELKAAQELALLAAKYKIISKEEANRLNAVQSSFDDAESIAKAIGNAGKVVITIGPNENGPITEVSTSDAVQVIQAAQLAGVSHVAIVYDGNAAAASTYNVLDGITSFFNNLFSQSQALSIPEFLQKVIETDVSYTFIKTSLTEDFSQESSYNLIVSAEGSVGTNDYKVAKSQIASVVADVFSNTAVAENKVVEIFTDPSAPSKSVTELFSAIPEDKRRKVYAETLAAKADEEAQEAADRARKAADAAKKLEEDVKKVSKKEAEASSFTEEAQEKAEAAGVSFDGLFNRAKDISAGFSWDKLSSQITNAVETNGEKPKVQVATVRGQAKARSLPSQKAVVKRPTPKLPTFRLKEDTKPKVAPKQATKRTESNAEVRKVFGGLFKQETIYVDDD